MHQISTRSQLPPPAKTDDEHVTINDGQDWTEAHAEEAHEAGHDHESPMIESHNTQETDIDLSLFETRKTGESILKNEARWNPKWFAKHKKDFGNAKKASMYIGVYFFLCFLVLLFVCVYEGLFHNEDIFDPYLQNKSSEIREYLTKLQIAEIGFIIMCVVPFIVAMIFVCKIWHISESWKIRQEILIIFLVTSVLFVGDSAISAFIFMDQPTRFMLKMILESMIMIWTTLISTIMVVHHIRKQTARTQRKTVATNHVSGNSDRDRFTSQELIKEVQQSNIVNVDDDGRQMIIIDNTKHEVDGEVPLGYVLSNQLGYHAFLTHCVAEFNVENLLFLAHVCYFKKRFLDCIKERQINENYQQRREQQQREHFIKANKSSDAHSEHEPLPQPPPANGMVEMQSFDTIEEEEEYDDRSKAKGGHAESFATVRTTIAVYHDEDTEDGADEEQLVGTHIEWSPSNCLAILTFRMCHNYERDHNRLTLIDRTGAPEVGRADQVEDSPSIQGKSGPISLYEMACNLYRTFIKEDCEYEINLPAKIKTKLDFFFHQNFAELDETDKQYHEYRLFHIFDRSWAEIWHLMTLNSYRRFLDTEHYHSIRTLLEIAMEDERKSLLRLIMMDSNNDQHIATLIESHDPYKRQVISPPAKTVSSRAKKNMFAPPRVNGKRLSSRNIEEMNELKPISMINISIDPLPIDEQLHHFGRPKTKVKKAKV